MIRRPTTRSGRRTGPELTAAVVVGVGISLSLSTLMLVAIMEHVSKLPMPLAVAFAAHVFGKATLRMTLLLPVGLLLHVGYVSTATVVARMVFRRRLGVVAAFGTALGLWVLAGVSVLPYLGWGVFGAGLGGAAVLSVLAVHLLYGAFLWVGSWLGAGGPNTGVPPGSARTTPATAVAAQR